MTLSEVQKEAGALGAEDRRKLAAFLTVLRMKESREWEEATSPELDRAEMLDSLDAAERELDAGLSHSGAELREAVRSK